MRKISSILFSILVVLFPSCNKINDPLNEKPRVLVSIAPYVYFVEKIAGDLVEISTLAPEGINPHIFEPTPKQVQEVYLSQLWVRVGEDFEQKIAKTLKENHKKLVVNDLSTKVSLHKSHCQCGHHHDKISHEAKDLHIWMSPKLAKIQAQSIELSLEEILPEHSETLRSNLSIFLSELDTLNDYIEKKLNPLKGSSILVSHPAFNYFCKDFDLKQISIETEGKDPTAKDLEKIFHEAKNSPVKLVLIQQQYNNKGAITIAQKLDLPTHLVDPYSKEYVKMLMDITSKIADQHD